MVGAFHPEESVMRKGPRRGQNQPLPPSHGKREEHGGETGAPTLCWAGLTQWQIRREEQGERGLGVT